MDYQFLLGKLFRWNDQLHLVSALEPCEGSPVVRVLTRSGGRPVVRELPAHYVARHLICEPAVEAA